MNNRNLNLGLALAGALFLSACDIAPAPRPFDGPPSASTMNRPARSTTPPAPDLAAIAAVQESPIEKLDGGNFKLADFRGKVLVLDFWATYCPPCVKQMPQLAELSKRYRDKGVVVVGLTSDAKSDLAQVQAFIKKAGATYTIGYDNERLSAAFLQGTEDETGLPPIPQLFLIGRDGRIVEHLIGDSPQRGIEFLEKAVSQQLALGK